VNCLRITQKLTNLIMSSRLSTEERSEKFRTRFSQISDADSTKSSSAASFIHEDDESFTETIIFLVFYEIWKAWSLVLDKETDQLYELNKQQEDEIKELKTRLQTKENTSSDFIYSERSRSQKYLILRCLLMKRTLLERTDTKKFRIN